MVDCVIAETDLFYLVDGSESIFETDFERVRNFVSTSAPTVPEISLGLAEYSLVFVPYTNSFVALSPFQQAVVNMQQSFEVTFTGTALAETLDFIVMNGQRGTIKRVILMTDGVTSDPDRGRLVTAIDDLEAAGVEVFAVGFGDQADRNELLSITRDSRKTFNLGFELLTPRIAAAFSEFILPLQCSPVVFRKFESFRCLSLTCCLQHHPLSANVRPQPPAAQQRLPQPHPHHRRLLHQPARAPLLQPARAHRQRRHQVHLQHQLVQQRVHARSAQNRFAHHPL